MYGGIGHNELYDTPLQDTEKFLTVSLIAFKAFIMACVVLPASILKKVSISEKKIVFLHRDIAVLFLVLHCKITNNNNMNKPSCHIFINKIVCHTLVKYFGCLLMNYE